MRRPLMPSTRQPFEDDALGEIEVDVCRRVCRAAPRVPPLRSSCRPRSIAAPLPDISSSTSAPSPRVRRLISSTRSRLRRARNVASAPKLFASSSFAGLTSIAKTRVAPAARATGIAIRPIEPTPVITTLLTLTPAAITVCTALPSGSKIAAHSSRDRRIEPPDVVLGNRDVLGKRAVAIDADDLDALADVRLAGAAEQAGEIGDVPSAETRSPTRTERTASPTAATVPMNSCPTTSGGLMRCCAHASQA